MIDLLPLVKVVFFRGLHGTAGSAWVAQTSGVHLTTGTAGYTPGIEARDLLGGSSQDFEVVNQVVEATHLKHIH